MRQAFGVSLMLLASLVVASSVVTALQLQLQQQQQQPNLQQEPAPEPYSFSYTADSQGGQSSHQESGDGSGRVTGFYTIRGEDGRERRVDYVADENGYRASVKTNEVGTRAEPSADAQYEVDLPSAPQLEAAKVTLEQYKYLEDVHAEERARSGRSQSRLSQQQQQQQLGGWQSQFGRQQQQGFYNNNNFSNFQQYQRENQFQNQLNYPGASYQNNGGFPTGTSGSSADYYARTENFAIGRNSRQVNGKQSSSTVAPASDTVQQGTSTNQVQYNSQEEGSKFQLSSVDLSQEQRPLKSWSNGRPNEKRVPTFLQQQLEQQFMLQANQLTNQDYPRQQQPLNQQQYNQAYNNNFIGQQGRFLQNNSINQSSALRQPFWVGSVNEQQQQREALINGQPLDNNQLPIIQQQSSSYNETDYLVGGEEQPEEVPVQTFRPQTQQQQIATGSLQTSWNNNTSNLINGYNNQSTPNGLVSINLSEEQEEGVQTDRPLFKPSQQPIKTQDQFLTQQQQQQQQQQELGQVVSSEGPQVLIGSGQQARLPLGQVNQQQVFREDQGQQFVTVSTQEPLKRRPDSINQIIDTVGRQPAKPSSSIFTQNENQRQQEVNGEEYQNQVGQFQQQVNFRPTTTTSTTTTTTYGPETTSYIQPEATTTTQQPIVYFQQQNNSTSTLANATFVPTTRAPFSFEPQTNFIQPQQPQYTGVKGGQNKFISQWMRQRIQLNGGLNQRLVPYAQQQGQWSTTSGPFGRPTQQQIYESTLAPELNQPIITSRPNQQVILPQVDYVTSTTRQPDQANYWQQQNNNLAQQQQFQGETGEIFNSRQVNGQSIKGGLNKTNGGRRFWNNGSQVAYANQGSFSPSRAGGSYSSSFGSRVSALRSGSGSS